MISDLMEKNSMTKYALAKKSGVPYTTVSDIVKGKVRLEKCEAETVYRLSKALGTTVDALLRANIEERVPLLVNKTHPLPENYLDGVELVETENCRGKKA